MYGRIASHFVGIMYIISYTHTDVNDLYERRKKNKKNIKYPLQIGKISEAV